MKSQKKSKISNTQRIVAKTRVVELKPDHSYLFMFDTKSGLGRDEIAQFMSELHRQKLSGIALYLRDKGGVEVYERKTK